MAKLLLSLRNVPDDEAQEVRALLEAHEVPFYETMPSFWGVSAGGIWVSSPEDFATAARLMAEYQQKRAATARAEYEAAKRAGATATLWGSIRAAPMQAIVMLLGIVLVFALMLLPFLMVD